MSAPKSPHRPLRLAHRGDHRHAPENTLAAFLAALELHGCNGLEFDVRLSGDGVPVILHDETLQRVQGRPERADELTADELDAAGIPRLADLLAFAPRSAFLDVELKVDGGAVVVDALRRNRGADLANAVISSFEPDAIATVRAIEPSWPCWLNAKDLDPPTLALAVSLGCRGTSVEWHAIDGVALEGAREAGLDVAGWTVVEQLIRDRLEALGVVALCLEGPALDS